MPAVSAVPAGSSVIEGPRTLEVRWLLPGRLDAAVAGWFGRFPGETEAREDSYLLNPDLRGLSVKVRAGRALEVKMYQGTAGLLEIPGHARGRIQSWQKWSFPVGPLSQDGDGPAGWTMIGKRRRISRFRLASDGIAAGVPRWASEPGCTVELTEVARATRPGGPSDFEAAGPADLLRRALEGTAALIFALAAARRRGTRPGQLPVLRGMAVLHHLPQLRRRAAAPSVSAGSLRWQRASALQPAAPSPTPWICACWCRACSSS